MISKIKSLFKKKDPELELVETIQGIKLYTFSGSPVELSFMKRYAHFVQVIRANEHIKLTREKREIIYTGIENAYDKGKFSEIMQYVSLMRQLDDATLCEHEIFEIANCFLLLEGEPLKEFSLEHTAKKKMLFETDEGRFFFINFTVVQMKRLIDFPEGLKFEEYLKSPKAQVLNIMYSALVTGE